MVWPEETMAMVAQSQPFSYYCSVNFLCPQKKERHKKSGLDQNMISHDGMGRDLFQKPATWSAACQEANASSCEHLETEAALTVSELDADQKLYDAYTQ